MYKVKREVEQKKAWGIIVILFLAMSFFSILGFYDKYYYGNNDKINEVTGKAVRTINPMENIKDVISDIIGDKDLLVVGGIFIALFSVLFVGADKLNLFSKYKGAHFLFALSLTIISMVVFEDFIDLITTTLAIGLFIAIVTGISILIWSIYAFGHKVVSKDIGEMAGVAAGREKARGDYLEGRGGYLDKRTAYLGKEGDYISKKRLEASKLSMINQLKPSIKEIGPVFQKLNQDATTAGIRTKGRINKLFNDLSNAIQLFQAYINKGDAENAVQIHTQIRALIGVLDGEIKRASKK